ncbi:HAMP domain-containing protein [candidate division KSB1 bacterium]|nr:HAMP domain-containing protein [candidate division KSB1 bacterium]
MFSFLRTFSLRAKLIIVYTFILGAGGLITSFIGSLIVNDTIMNQAWNKVHHDIKTARMVYNNQLLQMKQEIYAGACGGNLATLIRNNNRTELFNYLEQIRLENNLDYLTVTDENGNVIFRPTQTNRNGDNVSNIRPIQSALAGEVVASTEILTRTQLANEERDLAIQAHTSLVESPNARPIVKQELTSGLVLISASPIRSNNGAIIGALYGGHLLNKNPLIVDRVWNLVYRGEIYNGKEIGTVAIFFEDWMISTNINTKAGKPAIGTRVPEAVYDTVFVKGDEWSHRTYLVNDWYISRYEPIQNSDDEIIGILYVGLLERSYLAIRNRVVLTFIGVATLGFLLIVLISYLLTRSVTRPLGELVGITQSITTGDLNHEVKVKSYDEIGKLGLSFNTMVKSLKRMKGELEEWGKTLELKVKERTEELEAMQAKVIQTERLASLGQLAAGIAHEINNPLGGILVLSSLVLENLEKEDGNRQNLEEVVKQTIRCRDIVKGLLQFSRQTEAKKSLVNINDILNNTLALIEKQAMFHNIEVEKKFDDNLPLVLVDDSQYQQVFMNIILNAIQSMQEIGTLTLDTFNDEQENMVVVEIGDTGTGISEEIINKIFDPFFTTKEVGKGTGLGLSIAYGIVTRHNGKMTVKSEVGKGTVFTISTPAAAEEDSE